MLARLKVRLFMGGVLVGLSVSAMLAAFDPSAAPMERLWAFAGAAVGLILAGSAWRGIQDPS